jgi:hypothetical protein
MKPKKSPKLKRNGKQLKILIPIHLEPAIIDAIDGLAMAQGVSRSAWIRNEIITSRTWMLKLKGVERVM